jgi:class 3 adenylate cyclase
MTKSKTPLKNTMKMTLLFMDVIVLLAVFIGVFFLFEYVIKDILVKYNSNKFTESMKITQFDLINAVNYIENKNDLPYNKNITMIFEYLKTSTLKRSKYDNSIFLAVFPKDQNHTIAGKRNNPDLAFNPEGTDYDSFQEKIERIRQNTVHNETDPFPSTISFDFQGSRYIGTAQYAEIGIRKDFQRESADLICPILVIADRDDEFFFIIYRMRNTVLILLIVLFGIGAYIKILNTAKAAREIQTISNGMTQLSNEIKNTGTVKNKIEQIKTIFRETYELDNSFTHLVGSLTAVGDIISGIADKDLFIATLKNDNSLLKPHDEMMAVLFLDIQGFTTIAEKHNDDIMTILNNIWTQVENTTGAKGGKINKYMGDACLIIFRDQDAEKGQPAVLNAFKTAVELLELVPQIRKKLDIVFNFRIGLDYGKVTYGKTGTDNNFELGVIGDPVNTASRLETLNKQYHTHFLISDTAFKHTGLDCGKNFNLPETIAAQSIFKCVRIDKARPKGKKQAKELLTVLKREKKEEYSLVGSEHIIKQDNVQYFEELVTAYLDSIKYWKEYSAKKDKALKIKAQKNWMELIKKMGNFYYTEYFPPIENFIKSLLKVEEYEEFKANPGPWLKKATYNINEPSEEWIELGTKELEK